MTDSSSQAQRNAAPVQASPADRLSFTLFLALAFHAIVILGIGFGQQNAAKPSNTIEVTIAHKLSDTTPEEADFLAQANQEGAGDEAEKRELTTTEMAPFDDSKVEHVQLETPSTLTPQPVHTQQLVITTQDISSRQAPQKEKQEQPPKPLPEDDRESVELLSQEIASLQARLDAQKQAYAKRPRIRRLTSVSAKAHYEALYIDAFRREVEDMGTRNFPQRALRENKFGHVRLMVAINRDGTVREIGVLKSSGFPFLDEAAISSVRLASPFAPFTAEMKEKVDILEIIRTWKFDSREVVTSQ